MPARWRRGAVGDVLTAQLGFDEFLGERVLVTVDLNTGLRDISAEDLDVRSESELVARRRHCTLASA